MPKLIKVSALFALAVFVTSASAQPPAPGAPPKPAEKKLEKELSEKLKEVAEGLKKKAADNQKLEKEVAEKLNEQLNELKENLKKKADPTDAAIATALANDPDVKMARAKIQLAEAELAKARHTVTLKVVTLKAKIEQHKAEFKAAQYRFELEEKAVKSGTAGESNLFVAREKYEAAKGALAVAEAEWKLLTEGTSDKATSALAEGIGIGMISFDPDIAKQHAKLLMEITNAYKAPAGALPDRLRAVLDKPVKLGAKGEKITFAKAMEVFKKEAGLDVTVRPLPVLEITTEGESHPVGVWFQLFQDEPATRSDPHPIFCNFYVREYGLLYADRRHAPTDAPTVTEFWKQKPPALKPEEKPVPTFKSP